MKKALLILVLAFLAISIFAAPFGLKKGISINEIAAVCDGTAPKYAGNNCYYISPAKKHPLFQTYIAFVDSEKGLYCIQARSGNIKTNDYGTETKNAFAEIKDRVSKTYGTPKMIDKIAADSLFKDEQYWLYALEKGARTYAAIWQSNSKNQLKDDLNCIIIYASGDSYKEIGWITLQYDFSNKRAVEDSQDDVF
ncbi:MAG: hypothetical protein PUF61_10770 [Spirochaetales bacterium]|nr:hypothetical protein [Spirochaetales bacterium]